MTEQKHTPGRWLIHDMRECTNEIWIVAEHPEVGFVSHAAVRSGCLEADELGGVEANARLIASAQDLLAECRDREYGRHSAAAQIERAIREMDLP